MNIPEITKLIIREYAGASNKFGPFRSTHEGLGIIREEYKELENEIFTNGSARRMRHEAIQLGAMTIRFIYDLCNGDSKIIEKEYDHDQT